MNTRLPIRIAFCITELEPGGAERCLVELATRLDRGQFEPVVYCLGPKPSGNPISLADKLTEAMVPLHCFGARRFAQAPRIVQKLRQRLAIDKPEILQTFLFHANVLGTFAARTAGVPHLVTGIRVAERRKGWHLTLARWTGRWAQRHVAVSQAVKDFSINHAALPADRLEVIPNGVDVARFERALPCPVESLGVAAGRRIMTVVGRLDVQKGIAWLLEQMPRILAAQPIYDLVLVGTGPARQMLEETMRRLKLETRVHFAGFRADVPEILAASDLVLLSSQWEGMPNVVLEAMAAAKPVVATAVEGVTELLGPAAGPQTVPLHDAEAFVAKVVAILGDPDLAGRLGRENRERARSNFSLDSMVKAYEQLYLALARTPK